jgi:hypothetical protein
LKRMRLWKPPHTPVWVMMLTSACSFSVRQDSDISTQGTAPVYVSTWVKSK